MLASLPDALIYMVSCSSRSLPLVHYDEIKHILNNPTLTSQWGFVSTILTFNAVFQCQTHLLSAAFTNCIAEFYRYFYFTPAFKYSIHNLESTFKRFVGIFFLSSSLEGCDVTQNTIGIPHSEVIMLISFLLSFSLV